MRLFSLLLLLVSCGPDKPENQIEQGDDYVLIEFASKLEEDYHRLHKIPYDSRQHPTTDPHHP